MTTSFMAAVLPPPGSCRAGMKGGDSLFVCGWVCVCICQAKKKKGGKSS